MLGLEGVGVHKWLMLVKVSYYLLTGPFIFLPYHAIHLRKGYFAVFIFYITSIIFVTII
jgi:hypothetical protein